MNTLYKKLNISALDVFKLNRHYKFNDIASNIRVAGTLENSPYLNIADDNNYAYAKNSSPLNDNDEFLPSGLSEVCIKYIDNNEYKYFPFYMGYSLTYTQSVNINGINAYLYAYDYIRYRDDSDDPVNMKINVIHNPKNDEESVNVYSDITYSLGNIAGSLTNNSTLNLTAGNIKTEIIKSNTYGSASFDISYSYITPDDGHIYDDGKCIVDELTGVHVWSMNSYIDDEQYSYQDGDYTDGNNSFIVYTYINANQTLLDRLENSGTSYLSYALMDVSDENWWSQNNFKFVKASNDQAYLMYKETKQQYFTYLRPYNLTYNGNCVVDYRQPFSNIYRYPSWRDNKDYFYACQKMKTYVGNLSSIYPKLSDNFNNFNTSYFIKKIGNLPVHIVPQSPQSLQFELIVKLSFINSQSSGDNPEEGAIRFKKIELYDNDKIKYTINFKDDKTINLTPYNINDGEIKRTLRISHVDEFEIIDNDEYFKISDWKTTPNSSSFIPSFDPNNEHGNEYKISFNLTEKSPNSINSFYKFIENNSIINKIHIHLEASGSIIGITGPSFDINVEGTNDNSYYMGKKINGNYENYEYDIIEITRNNNETEHINGTLTYISITLNYDGLIHDGDNKN